MSFTGLIQGEEAVSGEAVIQFIIPQIKFKTYDMIVAVYQSRNDCKLYGYQLSTDKNNTNPPKETSAIDTPAVYSVSDVLSLQIRGEPCTYINS